ncbi:hypothetical protein [Pedococcus soli]
MDEPVTAASPASLFLAGARRASQAQLGLLVVSGSGAGGRDGRGDGFGDASAAAAEAEYVHGLKEDVFLGV